MKYHLHVSVLVFLWVQSFAAYAQDKDPWFEFKPAGDGPSMEIALDHWLEKPAGTHGFVQMKGERLVFEDGVAIKFWGTNLAGNRPFMPSSEVDGWVDFLAGYGFNAVRFHKFTWHATDGIHSTMLTDEKWEHFDFLCDRLRKGGIYYGWSHIYGHRVLPGDSARVLAYDELAATKFPWSHLNGTTASLVNFADDLQELNIELTVNMLNHINPLTGLRYAEDPALIFVEFQNEDNIFWGAIEQTLKQTPTYRKLLCSKFSRWLKAKYGSQEALEKAWGKENIVAGEDLTLENIYPQPNHGMFSWEYEQALKEDRKVQVHVLDKATFLYEEQMKFYRKFESAVRATGYRGPLVASCWQAGTGLAHFLNLYADREVGIIDRHNYFGGGRGHNLAPGPFDNAAMVSRIGSGLFGAGLQQVDDRPFAFSEWMSLIPNEWTAESAPIIASYGLGLHGWDASYVFATDIPGYTSSIQTYRGGIYNATSPTQLALYPALARMVHRGDIDEGETVVSRRIDMTALLQGETPVNETIKQDHDRKIMGADFPLQLMAAGKVTIDFGDSSTINLPGAEELSALWQDSTITSNTGQLRWSEAGKGYFTINTPGTKGLVGFAKDKEFELGAFSLKTQNEFAVIFISSLDKSLGLDESKRILISTMARARNTGMRYNPDHSELLETGSPPILLEPVQLALKIDRKPEPRIWKLDHDGNRTTTEILPVDGSWWLDGSESQAIYYLIEF